MITDIDEQLRALAGSVRLPEAAGAALDTVAELRRLATAAPWSAADFGLIDVLSKRIDVDRRLASAYDARGKPAGKTLSDPAALDLAVAILYKAAMHAAAEADRTIILKRLNSLFKAADLVDAAWLAPGSQLRQALDRLLAATVDDGRHRPTPLTTAPRRIAADGGASRRAVTRLPLTILFHEGPIARAYLEALSHLGLRPARIINLIAYDDLITRRPVGRWLPDGLRKAYAGYVQRQRIHHWPRRIAQSHPDLHRKIVRAVEESLGFPPSVVGRANALRPLSDYSDDIVAFPFRGMRDKALFDFLAHEPESVLLFTGGGILPSSLLSIPQLQFLHIHPGHLPEIRGADCSLWSLLLSGHTSASCFYMSPGIDTGAIIVARWLPEISIRLESDPGELEMQYRAVYSFLDPWVRAFVLRELVTEHEKFDDIRCTRQHEVDGTTYYFMHPKLQKAVLDKLFLRAR